MISDLAFELLIGTNLTLIYFESSQQVHPIDGPWIKRLGAARLN
jgi:hypothetical protein